MTTEADTAASTDHSEASAEAMLAEDEVLERLEVDGVPVWRGPSEGPLRVALMFRVGRADETATTAGVTHLVEHLTMFRLGQPAYQLNAMVDGTKTMFYARGEPAEMVEFLGSVCQALRHPPVDRMATEARVLRTEAAGDASPGIGPMLAWLREGTRGLGLIGQDEFFLQAPDPVVVTDWAARRFNAANAVLLVAGEMPDGLALPLPRGVRNAPVEMRPIPGLLLPAITVSRPGGVGVSFLVERSSRMSMTLRTAAYRMHQDLRLERGLSYNIGYDYDAINADQAHVTLFATCLGENVVAVQTGILAILGDLSREGPTNGDLERDIAMSRRSLADDGSVVVRLSAHGYNELVGAENDSAAALLAEMEAVKSSDGAAAMTAAMTTALMIVPDTGQYPGGQWHRYPGPAGPPGDGQTFAHVTRKRPWTKNTPRLVIGPNGVGLLDATGAPTAVVHWASCVAVINDGRGSRRVMGEDGYSVVIHPQEWQNGERATRLIDDLTPAGRLVHFGA